MGDSDQNTTGAAEELKGSFKEVAGDVTGNEQLREEGEAQQQKADAAQQAESKEQEARQARLETVESEAEQRQAQQ